MRDIRSDTDSTHQVSDVSLASSVRWQQHEIAMSIDDNCVLVAHTERAQSMNIRYLARVLFTQQHWQSKRDDSNGDIISQEMRNRQIVGW